MSNFEEIIRILSLGSSFVKNVLDIFSPARREKIMELFRKFDARKALIITNNVLMYIACIGIVSVGLALSILLLNKIELSPLGYYVSLVSFIPFALYSRFTFKIGYIKLAIR